MARQAGNESAADERVVRDARISWWALWHRVAAGLVAVAVAAWGLSRQDDLGYGIAITGSLLCVWLLGSALLRRMATKATLTERYVIVQSGLVSRHTSTVMLNRVESIDIDQSLWQRMTGYGTLTIRGTGSEDVRIVGIQDPVGFQGDARRAINEASGAGRA